MSLKLFGVFLLVFLASSAAGKAGKPETEKIDDVEEMEASSMVFGLNDEKNQTGETNDTATKSGWNETALPTSIVRKRSSRFPFRIGPWDILGLHYTENSWVCELRQIMDTVTNGSISTLNFKLRKNKSVRVENGTERCGVGCEGKDGELRFRVVVSWEEPVKQNQQYIRCVTQLYGQSGLLIAACVFMALALCCRCKCTCNGSVNTPPVRQPPPYQPTVRQPPAYKPPAHQPPANV